MTIGISRTFCALFVAAVLWPVAEARAADCAGLVGQQVGAGVVVSAEPMKAGHELALSGEASVYRIAPLSASICNVKAQLSPVPGSEINVEVWLPESWNGKFVGTGGGGFSGGLGSAPITLNPLVAEGYAAAATDVGHPASDSAAWAHGHPVQLVDYAHRGNHVTAEFAKALIAFYYEEPVERAYFQGCSNGGRDALMEAWRYPEDYDGIVAGAPAAPYTRDFVAMAWNTRAVDGPPAVNLTPDKLKLVSDAVMARCDGLDGVEDGVLENPRACRFEPRVLQCTAAGGDGCLSAAEVEALRALYQGPRTGDGRQISAGLAVGGEAVEWFSWVTSPKAVHRQMATEFFRWLVYGDEAWSLERFDLARDFAAAQDRLAGLVDSDDPDIRPFLERGGKLILWHGWADAALPPGNTISYYENVMRTAPAAAGQVRLFMVPGMAHCFGGPGPSQFDMLSAFERWFETGQAPERVIASKPESAIDGLAGLPTRTLRTRPLCAWPKQARWNGSGSTDDAGSFRCVAPSGVE